MYDLIVSGNTFLAGGPRSCDIGILDGRIEAVKGHIDRVGTLPRKVVLSRGMLVPGGIDAHVHFRTPGFPDKANISTESEAAVRGGTCTVLDMPNTDPPTTCSSEVASKLDLFERSSYANFGTFYGLTPGALDDEIDAKKALDLAVGSKLFVASSTGNLLVDDTKLQKKLIDLHKRLAPGKTLTVHAEDQPMIEANKKLPNNSTVDHDRRRPVEAEMIAVQNFISMTEGVKAHIAHVTSGQVVPVLRGPGVTAEVTPHHLFLVAKDILDTRGKVNPPLRSTEDQDGLWKAIVDGHIDMVASDHAPHTLSEKELDFAKAPSGVPGVGTMVPMMFAAAVQHRITMPMFVGLTSIGPAKVYGLSRKGAISKGMDADIVGFDPTKLAPIEGLELAHKCGWTPFEGMEAVMPSIVVCGGYEMVVDGEFHGETGNAHDVAPSIKRE